MYTGIYILEWYLLNILGITTQFINTFIHPYRSEKHIGFKPCKRNWPIPMCFCISKYCPIIHYPWFVIETYQIWCSMFSTIMKINKAVTVWILLWPKLTHHCISIYIIDTIACGHNAHRPGSWIQTRIHTRKAWLHVSVTYDHTLGQCNLLQNAVYFRLGRIHTKRYRPRRIPPAIPWAVTLRSRTRGQPIQVWIQPPRKNLLVSYLHGWISNGQWQKEYHESFFPSWNLLN